MSNSPPNPSHPTAPAAPTLPPLPPSPPTLDETAQSTHDPVQAPPPPPQWLPAAGVRPIQRDSNSPRERHRHWSDSAEHPPAVPTHPRFDNWPPARSTAQPAGSKDDHRVPPLGAGSLPRQFPLLSPTAASHSAGSLRQNLADEVFAGPDLGAGRGNQVENIIPIHLGETPSRSADQGSVVRSPVTRPTKAQSPNRPVRLRPDSIFLAEHENDLSINRYPGTMATPDNRAIAAGETLDLDPVRRATYEARIAALKPLV